MLMTDHPIAHTHVRRLVVTALSDGWEVREEEDADVITIVRRHDWHRVEVDRMLFDLRVKEATVADMRTSVTVLAEVT